MQITERIKLTSSERRVAELYRSIKKEAGYPGDTATALLVLAVTLRRRVASADSCQADDDSGTA